MVLAESATPHTDVLQVTAAPVLSARDDATLLVFVAGATTRKDAVRAVELLQQIDIPLVGTVLNGVTSKRSHGYDYGYRSEPVASQTSSKEPSGREREPVEKV